MEKYFCEIKSIPNPTVETIDLFNIFPSSESNCEYVRIRTDDTFNPVVNIKIESDWSPIFKQFEITHDIVVIGYGNKFGLYNFVSKRKIVELTFEGYFGSFKIDSSDIFIATDTEIINLDLEGKLKWKSENLGIDGVIIRNIDNTQIEGSGEYDPPGGWVPFKIDRLSGCKI